MVTTPKLGLRSSCLWEQPRQFCRSNISMSVKSYIQTDADSRYDWIAMLEKQNSYEIVASIKDSRVLLYRNKDKQKSIEQNHTTLKQVVYFIALASYTHFTMTVIIYSTSKWSFIKSLSGWGPIVAVIVIAFISFSIVMVSINVCGKIRRVARAVMPDKADLLFKQAYNKSGGTSLDTKNFSTMKLERSMDPHHIYEMGSLRL